MKGQGPFWFNLQQARQELGRDADGIKMAAAALSQMKLAGGRVAVRQSCRGAGAGPLALHHCDRILLPHAGFCRAERGTHYDLCSAPSIAPDLGGMCARRAWQRASAEVGAVGRPAPVKQSAL